MRFDISDQRFIESAGQWIRSLDDTTLSDLDAILQVSPGYYPTTLLSLWLAELQSRDMQGTTSYRSAARPASDLPVCHPADYEWRFSESTAGRLVETATGAVAKGDTIVHMGTPTTFAVGVQYFRDYRHVLMERSEAIITALASRGDVSAGHIMPIDLGAERPPRLEAGAAIVDPPWYFRDTTLFLAATSRVARLNACILLCQPTHATRPGVSEERDALLAELPRWGLACSDVQPTVLRYLTPHFEAMSLRLTMQGAEVPTDWRKGDLLLLKKMAQCADEEPQTSEGEGWSEAHFGPVRIKLRQAGQVDLGHLVPGDVLDTVSRRDPVRQQIGFWTSGNRVYSLANPETIGRFVELCNTDFMAGGFTLNSAAARAEQLSLPKQVCRKLFDILLIELEEHCAAKGVR